MLQDHKERLHNWLIFSFPLLGLGLFLALVGMFVDDWPFYDSTSCYDYLKGHQHGFSALEVKHES